MGIFMAIRSFLILDVSELATERIKRAVRRRLDIAVGRKGKDRVRNILSAETTSVVVGDMSVLIQPPWDFLAVSSHPQIVIPHNS